MLKASKQTNKLTTSEEDSSSSADSAVPPAAADPPTQAVARGVCVCDVHYSGGVPAAEIDVRREY